MEQKKCLVFLCIFSQTDFLCYW